MKIGNSAQRYDYRDDDDNYWSQPRALFELMSAKQKQALFDNTARALGDALDFIKERHIENCGKVHTDYGAGVKAAVEKLKQA